MCDPVAAENVARSCWLLAGYTQFVFKLPWRKSPFGVCHVAADWDAGAMLPEMETAAM